MYIKFYLVVCGDSSDVVLLRLLPAPVTSPQPHLLLLHLVTVVPELLRWLRGEVKQVVEADCPDIHRNISIRSENLGVVG